ncbi:hypothetical protein [Actinomadura nitritigenes]|uniref:hypothetical protein n=1 Tax=Actinomadura nitritigenes TaxID=134602 RepID=UPI003D8D5D3D
MSTWTVALVHHVANLVLAAPGVPDPGQGEAPPFAGPFMTVLRWGVYFALGGGVAGFVIIGFRMTIQHKRGEGGNHAGSLVIVAFGCIVIVSAAAIVTGLIGTT